MSGLGFQVSGFKVWGHAPYPDYKAFDMLLVFCLWAMVSVEGTSHVYTHICVQAGLSVCLSVCLYVRMYVYVRMCCLLCEGMDLNYQNLLFRRFQDKP